MSVVNLGCCYLLAVDGFQTDVYHVFKMRDE